MELPSIASSSILGLAYDPDTSTLFVQFETGDVYAYLGVPEDLYQRMLDAQPHPWSAHGTEVKSYPYRRIS
ncbi:KTSC domain-containing protein [Rathayibacter sp. YIM 133350]|uniref:KTSC domain-containing protein n=1 Tax=Rathayibacter sp. YIM 133350 TaxID=3131992 RepID=UPI00307F7DB1